MKINALAELIRAEILAQGGVMPFDRFMERALYCPKLGYYEIKKDSVGRRGDFYTSVSVGGLFGQLLAFQFVQWLEEFKAETTPLKIVEAGAHGGQLAGDILTWIKEHRPELFERLEYGILEPSASRQEWQRENLEGFRGKAVWHSGFDSLSPFDGVLFCNELLDAFPVRRLGWDAKNQRWFEWGVAIGNGGFVWGKIELAGDILPSFILTIPASLLEVLPDEYTVEVCPAAEGWWSSAAKCLKHGKLLAVDYGLTDEELFSPSRKNGTLRGYLRHQFADDVLADPGEQDLTAHVHFSAIQRAGEAAGLKTEIFSTQSKFLTRILEKTLKDKTLGVWTSARGRQFQTLTHPEHLGRAFRVLAQAR